RNCGERSEPWRARPVPFCAQGFLVVPAISLTPLVLCVPARRLASCQLMTRARMSRRTIGSPKTSSARSISPASLFSRLVTLSFISGPRLRLLRFSERRRERQILRSRTLRRVLHQHVGAVVTGHRADHEDQPALGVRSEDLQILRGNALDAIMTGHLLVLEGLARILALTGRTVAAMRDRDTVRRAQAAEVPPLHGASEATALGGANDIDELAGHEMRRRYLGADFEHRIGRHAKLDELRLRLDLGLRVMTAQALANILHLRLAHADLNGRVAILLGRAHGDDLAIVDLQHRNRHVIAGFGELSGHAQLLGDESGTHD